MLIDRPQIVEGTSIQNATVPSGVAFPSLPSRGELFYLISGEIGLYTYNGTAWMMLARDAELKTHIADDSRHLTTDQNILLDGITVTAAQLNSIPGINTRLTTAEGTLATHVADDSRHLTASQNTFLDGLNLPTLTAAHVNFVAGTTANIQTQLNDIKLAQQGQSSSSTTYANEVDARFDVVEADLSGHIANDARHLTATQNTFLDGITVDFAQVNKLAGIVSYLGAASLATNLQALTTGKLNVDGTNPMTANFNAGGFRLTNVAAPTSPSDAANKEYVDNFVQGVHWTLSARVATTANISLSNLQVIDGVQLAVGDRVLVKDQAAPLQNGIWIANNGSWTRAPDFNVPQEVNNAAVFVFAGTTQAKSSWVQLNNVTAVGTDAISWTAFSGPVVTAAGPGISLQVGGLVSVVTGTGLTFESNALALANVMTAGTYRSVTVDVKGRVIAGSNPTTLAGYGITDAVSMAYVSTYVIDGGLYANPTRIQLKRSASEGAVPTTAQLALGELAVNTTDGKVFVKRVVGGVETVHELVARPVGTAVDSSYATILKFS